MTTSIRVPYEDRLRILSLDTASGNLGITIGDFDLATGKYYPFICYTVNLNKEIKKEHRDVYYNRNDNFIRLQIAKDILQNHYRDEMPHAVAIEAAFCNPRLVTAFRSLTRAILAIELAFEIDEDLPYITVEASKAKKAVGAKGGNKDLVRKGITQLIKTGTIVCDIDLNQLDEHAIDSIAIGYAYGSEVYREVNKGDYYYV